MKWTATLLTHRGEKRIAIYFEKNVNLIARIKKLENVRWSATLGAWHLPDTDEYRAKFRLENRFVQNPEHQQKISTFKRWLSSRRYAENSIKTYTDALTSFLAFFNSKK